jgi:hypothetical protein
MIGASRLSPRLAMHREGSAGYLAAALSVLESMRRLGSLIRLLNRGGESSALKADQQFKIVVADKQRGSGMLLVRRLVEKKP